MSKVKPKAVHVAYYASFYDAPPRFIGFVPEDTKEDDVEVDGDRFGLRVGTMVDFVDECIDFRRN